MNDHPVLQIRMIRRLLCAKTYKRLLMAGGGVRRGASYGETDEFGNGATVSPTTIHDIHAAILYQMGINHEQLTFRHCGRDQRLRDVHGNVLFDIV
jgi:hypothetical protein